MLNTYLCPVLGFLGLSKDHAATCLDASANSQHILIPEHVRNLFEQHIVKFGKSYATVEEYRFRLELFAEKQYHLAVLNQENGSFTVGHNMFSTWTKDEYKKLLGYKPQEAKFLIGGDGHDSYKYLETKDIPEQVDWRQKGAVNPVKNQEQCGSCWAFSATAAIEGHNFIANGELLNLSEQQFVDCDKSSDACQGGWQANAMRYAEGSGQELTTAYPYIGRNEACQYKSGDGKVKVEGVTNVPKGSVAQLRAAIAQGPVSVTIEADQTVFQMYTGGILDSAACGTQLDHAVTAVGYGKQGDQEYYIVRNSWGPSWGENGYIKIAAVEGDGICGIQQVSVYPTIVKK